MSTLTNFGKILVIDDESEFVNIIIEILQSNNGYDIEGVTDPNEALELVKKNRYDLVITDLIMPHVDGMKITKTVKEHNPETEVIVITGFGSLESAMLALKQGVYDFMLKPFDSTDIVKTVSNAMERIRLRKENKLLTDKLEKTLSDLSTVYEISHFINSSYNLNEVLSFTTETLASSIGMETLAIFLWDHEKNHFCIRQAFGLAEGTVNNFIVQRGEGVFGQAFEKEDLSFINSYSDDPVFQQGIAHDDKERCSRAAVFPLRAADTYFGAVIIFQIDDEKTEDMDKIRLALITMTQVTPIIRFYLYKNEQAILWSDPLYQVKEEMKSILEKARLYKGGLTFLIFKLYLKHGGSKNCPILDIHQEILKKIKSSVSAIDSVIVFGIDSFVVILQGRTHVVAEIFAGTIKKEVETDVFHTENVDFVLDYGYARFPTDGTTAEELIGQAQFNLWSAVKGK